MTARRLCPTTLLKLVLAATMLVSAGVVALPAMSQAQDAQVTCPDGTTLAADGVTCLTPAVDDNVTTSTSCTVGVLSADGTQCIVPRLDAAPAPADAGTTDARDAAPVPKFTG